jgi:hypothetical protein
VLERLTARDGERTAGVVLEIGEGDGDEGVHPFACVGGGSEISARTASATYP